MGDLGWKEETATGSLWQERAVRAQPRHYMPYLAAGGCNGRQHSHQPSSDAVVVYVIFTSPGRRPFV